MKKLPDGTKGNILIIIAIIKQILAFDSKYEKSKFFISNIVTRISGALIGALLFYLITNFGVWSLGSYGYNLNGILTCYTLALPFFAYSLISTFIFSGVIEFFYKLNFLKLKISK